MTHRHTACKCKMRGFPHTALDCISYVNTEKNIARILALALLGLKDFDCIATDAIAQDFAMIRHVFT